MYNCKYIYTYIYIYYMNMYINICNHMYIIVYTLPMITKTYQHILPVTIMVQRPVPLLHLGGDLLDKLGDMGTRESNPNECFFFDGF